MVLAAVAVIVVALAVVAAVVCRRVDRLTVELRSASAAMVADLERHDKTVAALTRECRHLQSAVEMGPGIGLVGDLVKSSVVVSLKSGSAFRGVLYDADEVAVVLKNAEKAEGGTMLPVDGEVVVLRDDIDFVQRP